MSELLLLLLVAFVIVGYISLVFFGDQLSHALVRFLKKNHLNGQAYSTLWKELDTLRFQRTCVIGMLLVLLIGGIYVLWTMMPGFSGGIVFFLLLVVVIIFFVEWIKKDGTRGLSYVAHGEESRLQSVIEAMGIASGVGELNYRIVANSTPTAFTVAPFFEKPTIHITTSLLNLTEYRELEAVIAHEYSQVVSGRIRDRKYIDILIVLNTMVLFLVFMLGALLIGFAQILVLSGVAFIYMNVSDRNLFSSTLMPSIDIPITKIAELLLPPLAVFRFCSNVVSYYFTSDEDFWADLYCVYITRNPSGLYTILEKLKKVDYRADVLPLDYENVYFTGEVLQKPVELMTQARIEDRQFNLTFIDSSLASAQVAGEVVILKCPLCGTAMEELPGVGHYEGQVSVDVCVACGSVWYDEWELYFIADVSSHRKELNGKHSYARDDYDCPRCKVPLMIVEKNGVPEEMQVWSCVSCHGNFLEHNVLEKFAQYRKTKLEKLQVS